MKSVSVKGSKLFYHEVGEQSPDAPCYLWAHGWGQNHKAFLKLLAPFENRARHLLIDFPGFGESPEPPTPWGTEEYADMVAEFIREQGLGSVIWIGHSFGCRVGLQMAAKYPELVSAQVYIAGAGLRLPKPFAKRLYFKGRIALYKMLKKLIPFGLSEPWLMGRFGSRDYKDSSGIIRQIFVKVVNENLVEQAKKVACPTLLVYGEKDTEAPPEIGKRLNQLIKNSELVLLENQDHYSVLDSGIHPVAQNLNRFIQSLNFAKN